MLKGKEKIMEDITVTSKKHDGIGTKIHFSKGDNHYVASDNGIERLIFEADKNGNIIDWSGVYDRWTNDVIDHLFED